MARAEVRWAGIRRLAAAVIALATLCNASSAQATELQVFAVVQTVVRLQVLARPDGVMVSEADIARGYVEVAAPLQVEVRSNARAGYLLAIENQASFVQQASVRGLQRPAQLGAHGGTIVQASAGTRMTTQHLSLTFRIELAAGAQPGAYPWPFQVSAEPI